MTERHSKSRQQAEIVFAKTQSQFLGRDRAAADADPTKQARAESIARLKAARLAKEAEDHAGVVVTAGSRQSKKT